MSWIQKLYETYNNCQSWIGKYEEEGKRPLLPICHITAQAHIEIVIDQDGNFRRARVITDQKSDAITIIPCTEDSAGKVGIKPVCHPLCDKLQYVAGDFTQYSDHVTSGFINDPQEPHRNYVNTLTQWCESEYRHPKATSILKFINKKSVINDLIACKILFIGDDGKLSEKGEVIREKNAKDIFSIISDQAASFVRWIVETQGDPVSKTWLDKTLWKSWIDYYSRIKEKEPMCFVTGEDAILTNYHSKYIRARGDGAKIISSNDTNDFTFRGHFLKDNQACNISLEVSHKAHNALIWLIERQGKVFYVKGEQGRMSPGLTVVAWSTSDRKIPQPTDDACDILGFDDLLTDEPLIPATAQNFALKLKNKIMGYQGDLKDVKSVQIMSMDSASKGRMAITYYQERDVIDYLDRINQWNEDCAWKHSYRYRDILDDESGKNKRKFYTFIGAPAPIDIATSAYGENASDRLKQATITRILPCIIEGRPLPRVLVESTIRRACNRIALDNWEWTKALSIACALFRKYNIQKEVYSMSLDENRKTRDYLYGRLLALADSLEEWALNAAGEDRPTNAARLMQRFSEHPYSTWRTIELALTPYKARLGGKSKKRQRMIDEVIASFNADDFMNDRRLSGEFLLGYHSQREYLRPQADSENESDAAPK